MPISSTKTICAACNKQKITYPCEGCSQRFCRPDLDEHQKNLEKQLDHIENEHDQLRQNITDQKTDPSKHPMIKQINQWEDDAIREIKQTAERCREKFTHHTNEFLFDTERELNDLAEQIKEMRHEKEFNEIDLDRLTQTLHKVKKELAQPLNISVEQESTSLINNISVRIPFHRDTRWKQHGITIAGGNGQGNRLDQLSYPFGLSLDDNDQTIYIADQDNARIVEWKTDATNGQIAAGGNEPGDQIDLSNKITDVLIDRENNSLLIADHGKRQVMRWSRQTSPHGQIIISDIDCSRLTMDKDGSLYVSNCLKNEVKRWKKGETKGTIVAGGNGEGNQLNQLHRPAGIFVDDDQALYVADKDNNRVVKWMKDAKEGIVVAGGNGKGDHAKHLYNPSRVILDKFGQIYVADAGNDRVMRWCEGAKEGTIVIGGNGRGQEAHQLHRPMGLSFDAEGNLYVVDWGNHRIQKFLID